MIISDLLRKRAKGIFEYDAPLKCDVIAMDAKDGRILFDTSRNKHEHIRQFESGEIISIWADIRQRGQGTWTPYFVPIIKCYISHNSWKEDDHGNQEG